MRPWYARLRLACAAFSLAALAFGASNCTTLGPMPAVTGLSPVPEKRPGVEIQGAVLPGYYLSEAVQDSPEGSGIQQFSLAFEPGRWVGVPGLALAARFVGEEADGGYLEPMLRYRLGLDEGGYSGLGFVLYGTRASGSRDGASYTATRAGGEASFDARVTPESRWAELHFLWSLSATSIVADGEYCTDQEGRFGIDCPDEQEVADGAVLVRGRGEVAGLYPSAGAALALDFARHRPFFLHDARLALHFAYGTLPRVEYGEQVDPDSYFRFGASLTLRLGPRE